MERRTHPTAGPLLVIASSLLLAAGFRLNEEPAMVAASRAVRARPLANASAAAHWMFGALWSDPGEPPESSTRCTRKDR
jgi:hypothetical protein